MTDPAWIAVTLIFFWFVAAIYFHRATERMRENFILTCLSDGRPWYGLDLVKASDGLLSPGTVYVTLGRMEERGLIVGGRTPPGVENPFQRRVYVMGRVKK